MVLWQWRKLAVVSVVASVIVAYAVVSEASVAVAVARVKR